MITQELIAAVKDRAKMLAHAYYFLDKEDLIQDGVVFLLQLEKNESLTKKQKYKAINNYFSNIQDKAKSRRVTEINISSLPEEFETPRMDIAEPLEARVEREQITDKLLETLDYQEKSALSMLSQGYTVKEIAQALGISKRLVIALFTKLKRRREELNETD